MDDYGVLYAQLDRLISICDRFISSRAAQSKTTFLGGGLADGDFIDHATKGIEEVCREHFAACPAMIKRVGYDYVTIDSLRDIAPPLRYIGTYNVPVCTQVRIYREITDKYRETSPISAHIVFDTQSGGIRGPSFETAGQLREILREMYPIEEILKSKWFAMYGRHNT